MPDMNDARDVLGLYATALINHRIKPKEANVLSKCVGDFTELATLRLKQFKKTHRRPPSIIGLPSIRPVRDFLIRGKYRAAIVEARQTRAAMVPILKRMKETVKEL